MTCGLRVVIQNEQGELVVTTAKRILASNFEEAEAIAVRYWLHIVRRFGYQNVVLQSDASNMINNVTSYVPGFSTLCLIIEDIQQDGKLFNSIVFVHVRRAGNSVAHSLARWNLVFNSEHICIGSFT
ncbi:hypothetical protein POM88_025988 [Heracleum sosnowskyi]|uniref:RNase H type-1 domain-containing protein n=1 Tax=Heracleum sosnowskyi TaxID=360622 RepID=A0AAD8I690_9APIA|nr:hypothetical protein POM88_025988 [Heracleum sosnowskyi]